MPDDVDVLVISPPTSVWGAQLRLLDYAPALADRGVRLTLGSLPDGALYEAWVASDLPHREVAIPFLEGFRDEVTGRRLSPRELIITAARVARGATALLRSAGDFDAIWSFALRTHPLAVAAARMRRVPVAIEIVDIVRPGGGRRLLPRCAASADLTIVNSEATGATLQGRGRTVEVIHPGVDTHRFRPGPPPAGVREQLADDGGVLVGIVGRIDPMKGIDVLVNAMALVPADLDVRLVVVGDVGVGTSGYADRLEGRAGELLGSRARFVGRRDDVPDVLRSIDILVNASPAEPFGRSVLEAQATGLAVIGTRQGGIPEFVADGETGLLVEPGDVTQLAAAITELAKHRCVRERLGTAARTQAVECFDIRGRYDVVADVIGRVARR